MQTLTKRKIEQLYYYQKIQISVQETVSERKMRYYLMINGLIPPKRHSNTNYE